MTVFMVIFVLLNFAIDRYLIYPSKGKRKPTFREWFLADLYHACEMIRLLPEVIKNKPFKKK